MNYNNYSMLYFNFLRVADGPFVTLANCLKEKWKKNTQYYEIFFLLFGLDSPN